MGRRYFGCLEVGNPTCGDLVPHILESGDLELNDPPKNTPVLDNIYRTYSTQYVRKVWNAAIRHYLVEVLRGLPVLSGLPYMEPSSATTDHSLPVYKGADDSVVVPQKTPWFLSML